MIASPRPTQLGISCRALLLDTEQHTRLRTDTPYHSTHHAVHHARLILQTTLPDPSPARLQRMQPIDYRAWHGYNYVPPAADQRTCSACYAFTARGVLDMMLALNNWTSLRDGGNSSSTGSNNTAALLSSSPAAAPGAAMSSRPATGATWWVGVCIIKGAWYPLLYILLLFLMHCIACCFFSCIAYTIVGTLLLLLMHCIYHCRHAVLHFNTPQHAQGI